MNLTLGPIASRILAIALLGLVLLIAGVLVGWPFGALRSLEAEIDTTNQRLAAFQKRAVPRQQLAEQRDLMLEDNQTEKQTLAGDTPALAGAQLQRIVTTAIEEVGARLTSTQALPVVLDAQFHRVALRVQMLSDIATLSQVVYALESQKPFIFIEDLYVRANSDRFSEKQADKPVNLTITFEIYAYAKNEAG